jgi:predicted Ser/Thr protein kinase
MIKTKNYNTPALKREDAIYISGYTDGEGCFCVSFSRRPKNIKVGLEVKPSFAIGQNFDRRQVLDLMEEYFECGFMRRDYADKTLKYEVRSLERLLSKVIPHFYSFPLKSSKQKDFLLFAEICRLMKNQKHLEVKGFRKIVELAYKMNGSGKRKYSKSELFSFLKTKI